MLRELRVFCLFCICSINYQVCEMTIPSSLFFNNDILMGNKTALHLLANKNFTRKNGTYDFTALFILYNNNVISL